MEQIGTEIRSSTCKNCARPLMLIRWDWSGDIWTHTDPAEDRQGGMQGKYCPGSSVGEPADD